MSRLYIVTLLISLISRIHHAKSQNGGNSSWNQNGGRNINNLRYADDTTLMAESEEEPKSLLMKVIEKRESWFKTQHSKNEDHAFQSHHFIASKWGDNGITERIYFLGLQSHCRL